MGKRMNKLSNDQIIKQYKLIKQFYDKYLKKFGVDLPKLIDSNKKFTKNALTLVYLSVGYPQDQRSH